MKKTILLLFTVSLLLISCKEDTNPPTAGFSLDNTDLVRWDKATVASSATAASETTYTVTGGEFEVVDATIQFLEVASYTITQTVTNEDGTDETSLNVSVIAPDNKYVLEGNDVTISDNPFWYDATAMGGTVYLRLLVDGGLENLNLIKLYPVAGPDPLQRTYSYSDTGGIGTYDAGMTANYAGFNYDWTTSGNGGDDFVIELVYEDTTNSDNNIYQLTLPSYTLNYGNWDFATGTFIGIGTKSFSLTYRGKIDPV